MLKRSRFKSILWGLAMCAAASAASGSGLPLAQRYLLLVYDVVEGQPDPSRFFELMSNGVVVENGVTDTEGRVYTSSHQAGQVEDWLIRFKVDHYVKDIDQNTIGALSDEYLVHIDADGHHTTSLFYQPSMVTDMATTLGYQCVTGGQCSTQTFLWLQTYGNQRLIGGAHYWILDEGKIIDSGHSGADGMIYVRDPGSRSNHRVRLDLVFCTDSDYAIDMDADGTINAQPVEHATYSAELRLKTSIACTHDPLIDYAVRNANFLQGRPLIHAGQVSASIPVALANVPASELVARLRRLKPSAFE